MPTKVAGIFVAKQSPIPSPGDAGAARLDVSSPPLRLNP